MQSFKLISKKTNDMVYHYVHDILKEMSDYSVCNKQF